MSVIAPQLNYEKKVLSHPSYRFSNIPPLSGSTSQTILPTSSIENLFEIPQKVFNLSRSMLSFTATPAAGTHFNYSFEDVMSYIQQIQLYTRSGVYLADVNNLQNYVKIVRGAETSSNEFESMDPLERFYKSNSLVTANIRPGGLAGQAATNNYIEPQHLRRGTDAAADPVISVQIKLDFIKNSIFALDKDLYVPEVLVLRVLWSPGNKIMYNATSAADPVAGAAAVTGNIALTNINLYLAVEQNQEVANSLMAKVQSGSFAMLTPYVYSFKNFLSGTQANVSLRFNNGHGRTLSKIFHSPFNATESSNLAYDNDNTGGRIISSYYTQLNNVRMSDQNLASSDNTDWLMHKDLLRGSTVLDAASWRTNFFHLQDFSAIPPVGADKQLMENSEHYVRFTTIFAREQVRHLHDNFCYRFSNWWLDS
jgi:hypothetical protein